MASSPLVFLFSLLAVIFVEAADLPCVDKDGTTKLPTADNCPNDLGDATCDKIFPITAGKISDSCKDDGFLTSSRMCRKNCWTCCRDPKRDCNDDTSGVVDCAKADCNITVFHDELVKYCGNTCGFCDEQRGGGGCSDVSKICDSVKLLCNDQYHCAEIRARCRKTCNACDGTAPMTCEPPSPSTKCEDKNPHCIPYWCNQATAAEQCKKTCGLCV